MKKIYYLKTCSTCQRIIKGQGTNFEDFELQNIKVDKMTNDDLSQMRKMADSYKSLFSKRSQTYKKMNLKEKSLSEEEMKDLILLDYTFLKRPVIIDEDKIFIGSEKNTLKKLNQHFNG